MSDFDEEWLQTYDEKLRKECMKECKNDPEKDWCYSMCADKANFTCISSSSGIPQCTESVIYRAKKYGDLPK